MNSRVRWTLGSGVVLVLTTALTTGWPSDIHAQRWDAADQQPPPPGGPSNDPQPGYPGYGPQPGEPGAPQQQPYPQQAQPDPQQQQQPYPGYPQQQPQQPYPGYPQQQQPYPGYPQQQQPQQQPYPGYPQQQPQPYPGYPQQAGAPPAPAPSVPPVVAQTASPTAKLVLTAVSEEAKTALLGCLDAVENLRWELSRSRCADAQSKDPQLALATALLAQVATTPVQAKERAKEATEQLSKRALADGERLFVEALIALAEGRRSPAKKALDGLVQLVPGDRRAVFHRGLLHYRYGNLEGAKADFEKATQLDGKFGPAWNALGFVLLRGERPDDALKAFEKYAEVAPKEANAFDSLASFYLRKGQAGQAAEAARKAVELDPKFGKAQGRLGDAQLCQGNATVARRAYAAMASVGDAGERHDAVMRSARSHLFEALGTPTARHYQDTERELQAEVDLCTKQGLVAERLHALIELCRLQIERGALAEAGQTLRRAQDLLPTGKPATGSETKAESGETGAEKSRDKAAPPASGGKALTEEEKTRYGTDVLSLRAMLLWAVGERGLAEERAVELEALLPGLPGLLRGRELRGDLAARTGDRQQVVKLLDGDGYEELRPVPRFALALALGGGKAGERLDAPRARTLMEALSRRCVNDLEGALTRGRARAWLKQTPAEASEK